MILRVVLDVVVAGPGAVVTRPQKRGAPGGCCLRGVQRLYRRLGLQGRGGPRGEGSDLHEAAVPGARRRSGGCRAKK